MSLTHRLAQLERRVPRSDALEPPPTSKTLAEWLERRDAEPAPSTAPRRARGYIDGPPVAATFAEWEARAKARAAENVQ